MGRWTTGVERPDDPTKPMEATGPDWVILAMRIVIGLGFGHAVAVFVVALWLPHDRTTHYELLIPLSVFLGYPIQAAIFYGQPFGHDLKLGNGPLPTDLLQWPLEVRQALDQAEAALSNPWNGSGYKVYRTRKAIAIRRKALEKATGESAQFLVGEIEGLERLLTLLH